jgi:ORF6N domain
MRAIKSSNYAMRNKAPDIRILTIRDQKVVLDSDLAAVYGVTTKRLNEQFRRNRKRFPEDFAFQLTAEEFAAFNVAICDLRQRPTKRRNDVVAICDHIAKTPT